MSNILRMFIIIIAHILSIATALYGLTSWFLQTGFFAYLIRLEDKLFGNYFPVVTGMLMVFFFWAAPLLVIRIIMPNINLFPIKGKDELTEEEFRKKLKKPYIYYLLGVIASGVIGGMAFLWAQDSGKAEEITVDLSLPLERPFIGKKSLWFKEISLVGEPMLEQSYLIETTSKKGRRNYDLYVPIKPLEGDQPVQFVCNLSGSKEADIAPNKISNKGYIIPFVVPVLTRDYFAEQGITLADHVYIMGDSDFDEKTAAYIGVGIAGLALIILLVLLISRPIANKKKLKEWLANRATSPELEPENIG